MRKCPPKAVILAEAKAEMARLNLLEEARHLVARLRARGEGALLGDGSPPRREPETPARTRRGGRPMPVPDRVRARVLGAVASVMCLSVEDIAGPRRCEELVRARNLVYLLLRERGYAFAQAAAALGRCSHESARLGFEDFSSRLPVNRTLRLMAEECRRRLAERKG
jgi:hypothetical protein